MPRVMQTAKRSIQGGLKNWVTGSEDGGNDTDAIPPFKMVSKNLGKIGGMTIEHFLHSPSKIDDIDIPYHIREIRETSPTPPPPLPPSEAKQPIKSDGPSRMQCVAQLHNTCVRIFGKTDMLKFESIEIDGPSSKRCILTITRPNGARRSYQTPGVYSRKSEAKSQTAALAIEMGAIDFISTGDPDQSKAKKGLVLAPLDATGDGDSVAPTPEDPGVKEIEDCCVEWRAGRVKPYWVALTEPKYRTKQGYALRIELSPHSIRVYSCDTEYETVIEARAACAKIALDQGVLEFIKHGNGQVEPEQPPIGADADAQEAETKGIYASLAPWTLQAFYEAFPQPFPENFGDKSAVEINAPSWLHTTIQEARGGRLSTNFIWTTSGNVWGGNPGLIGCLLRIERPGESKSYLVDARFPKRADAKAAVCLQAISQGVGGYIRGIGRAIENKITPIMRRWANDLIFPTLGSECSKIRPGTHPKYVFQKEKDAYGCTMTLELSSFPTAEEAKTFSISPDYRTKADAKIAVACLAAEQGAVEFLRFRGDSPPPGYQTFHSTLINGTADAPNKRKCREEDGFQGRKKSKMEGDRHTSSCESKDQDMARPYTGRPSRPYQSGNIKPGNNNGWKNHHGPASSGFGTISRPTQGPPAGQIHARSKTKDDVTLDYGVVEPQASIVTHAPLRPGPQAPAVLPGPSRLGPVTAGRHPPFTPGRHGRHGQGGPQAAPPHASPFASRPPPQTFPQAGEYPASGFVPAPRYYPPGSIPMPPYARRQEHYDNVAGPSHLQVAPLSNPLLPYSSPAAPALSYGSYPGAQYPQPPHYPAPPSAVPPHMYHPQYQYPPPYSTTHGQCSPTPPDSAPNPGSICVPDDGMSPAPAVPVQPPYNVLPRQPLPIQQDHSVLAPVPAQATKSADGRRVVKCSQRKSPPTNDMQTPNADTQRKVTPAPVTKFHVESLIDYCTEEGVAQPQFHQMAVTDDSGKITYKVWIILGNEKLELPVTFATVNEGRESVAKQVLGRLRSQGKKNKH